MEKQPGQNKKTNGGENNTLQIIHLQASLPWLATSYKEGEQCIASGKRSWRRNLIARRAGIQTASTAGKNFGRTWKKNIVVLNVTAQLKRGDNNRSEQK